MQAAPDRHVRSRARRVRRAAQRSGAQGRSPYAGRGNGWRGERLGQRHPDDARSRSVRERRDGAPARHQRYVPREEQGPSQRHDFRARRHRRIGRRRRQVAHRCDRARVRRLLQLLRCGRYQFQGLGPAGLRGTRLRAGRRQAARTHAQPDGQLDLARARAEHGPRAEPPWPAVELERLRRRQRLPQRRVRSAARARRLHGPHRGVRRRRWFVAGDRRTLRVAAPRRRSPDRGDPYQGSAGLLSRAVVGVGRARASGPR